MYTYIEVPCVKCYISKAKKEEIMGFYECKKLISAFALNLIIIFLLRRHFYRRHCEKESDSKRKRERKIERDVVN